MKHWSEDEIRYLRENSHLTYEALGKELGVKTLRFDDLEVIYETEFVLKIIEQWIIANQ